MIDKLYPDESIFRREELRNSLEQRMLVCTCNSQKSVSMVDSLTDGNYKRATFMCLALALFNQLSGVNVITFYSTQIFDNVNMKTYQPINVASGNLWLSVSRTFGALFSVLPFRYLPRR